MKLTSFNTKFRRTLAVILSLVTLLGLFSFSTLPAHGLEPIVIADYADDSTNNVVDSLGDLQFAPDRVLVRLADTGTMQAFSTSSSSSDLPDLGVDFTESRLLNPIDDSLFGDFSLDSTTENANNVYVLTLAETGKDAVENAVVILNANPAVDIAEPDFLYDLSLTPNDPQFNAQYALGRINAQQAWEITTGSKNIVVGVIDSGIDGTHPDLISNLWVNPNPGLGGYINDIHGYCFTGIGNNGTPVGGIPTDRNGHGTHVAGIIGANGNNGIGITGINWDVSLAWMGINYGGNFVSSSAAIEALNYANLHNIPITNNSWGGAAFSQLLYDAVRDYNGLFIASAGNSNRDNNLFPSYPASFDLPNVISVASTDASDRRSTFSNFGVNSVHIAAPGSDILSTFPNNTYREASGTSMASPYVAGVAALMLAITPNLEPERIKEILIDTARHPDVLIRYGFGILDAGAALQFIVDVYADVNITHEMTHTQIEAVIHTALASSNFVSIGGSNTVLAMGLNVTIAENKTIVWNATFEANTSDSALTINGGGTFTVGRIGSISNRGTGAAININSELLEVNIIGGTVRAREGFAITGSSHLIRQSVPVNLDSGIVFAYGTEATGVENSVIHNDHNVIKGDRGVVVAWDHTVGQTFYERDTTQHLSSNPNLTISGVRWCANQQGIVNTLNTSVVKINDVHVIHSETVVLVQTMSAIQIRDSISVAFRDNNVVTVEGFRVGLTNAWGLNIPTGKTLIWKAEYNSTQPLWITGGGTLRVDGGMISNSSFFNTIEIWDNAALEVIGGGTVANTGSGTAIHIFGASAGVTVSNGTIRANSGFAISSDTNGRDTPVNITGGVVFSHGTSTTGTTSFLSVIHSGQNLSVTNNGVVIAWNRAEGITQYVKNTNTHLVSNPELSVSGVQWCIFAQGIVNELNDVVIQNTDTTVVENSATVNIIQTMDATQIASAIHNALNVNDVVTVTGSRIEMATALNLTIPVNKTVVFKAEYSSISWATFNVTGDGKFIVTDGGSIINLGPGNALTVGGTVSVDIAADGMVANTGIGNAIIISSGSVEVISVTGGFVYAGEWHAITSAVTARDVPINIDDGVVFSHGTSIAGIDNTTSVIRQENPLTVGNNGVIIAWNQATERIIYSDGTTVNLVSNPSVDISGVKWSYAEQGIINARNSIVIKPENVTVIEGLYINPVLTQDMTIEEIQTAIHTSFGDGDVVTVTGSRTGLGSSVWIKIPAGKTLIWKAELCASQGFSTILIGGEGVFEVADGGLISNTGTGAAIEIDDTTVKVINITGGTVRARQGLAIRYHSDNVPVNITGGVVFAHGREITGFTTGSNVFDNRLNYTVSGSGMVIAWNQARGQTEYINNSTVHLLSSPSLSSSGIRWCYDAQGIANSKNNVVIKIDNVSVNNNPFTPVSDVVDLNLVTGQITDAISNTLEDNDIVTVIGSRAIGGRLNLIIPDSKKIVWKAETESLELDIRGAGIFEVAEGGLISSIFIQEPSTGVNVTGGIVRAGAGFAISSHNIAPNVPINISGGVVFAHGTSVSGTTAASSVIHSENLTVSGTGVVIAWDQTQGRFSYDNETTLHLVSNPDLVTSGVKWCIDAQGIINSRNDTVVRIAGVTVTAQAWSMPAAVIDFVNERLTGLVANAAYTINGLTWTADANGLININAAWMSTTVSIIRSASDGNLASAAQNLMIPARPGAPTDINSTNTTDKQNNGTIAGVTNLMEFRLVPTGAWTNVTTAPTVMNRTPGTYEVRLRSTVSAFASETVSVTIGIDASRSINLTSGTMTFSTQTIGYIQPAAQSTAVINTGNQATQQLTVTAPTGYQVSLSQTAGFANSITIASIEVDGTATFWTRPNTGLGDGIHTGNVTVESTTEQTPPLTTQTRAVSFTINPQLPTLTTPSAPTLAERTHNSVRLNEIAGAEFGINTTSTVPTSWQNAELFSSLNPNTTYFFFARMAETPTHEASPPSDSLSVTTDRIPLEDTIPQNVVNLALESESPFISLSDGDSTIISAESLQAVRESGKLLEIELSNGLVIRIDPELITNSAITLNIHIDVSILDSATTINNVHIPANSIVISPSTHGNFGFTKSFDISAGELLSAGLNSNTVELYHICSAGMRSNRTQESLVRNADGSVTVNINSASRYILSSPDLTDPTDPADPTEPTDPINPPTPPPPAGNQWRPAQTFNRFNDVPNAPNWQNNAVSWAYRNNITTGTSDTTFSPDDPVTRAQFVTFLHRIFGRPDATKAPPFIDMPGNVDFQNAISWAFEVGITTGSPANSNTFHPNRNITREEIAAMLHRFIDDGAPAPNSLGGVYTDENRISPWSGAREAVNWAVHHKIKGQNTDRLNPGGNATRAEAVTMLYRVVEIFEISAP